jgi:hydroxymethylpyrimidine pyrophosphatase-like HAD family hydrolase
MNFHKEILSHKIIAVDFDGTIVEHQYPDIGPEMLFAFATLRELQKKGHKLILWTYREGPLLNEAVEYCLKNGIQFFAMNENYPGETKKNMGSRKIYADIYIDDRNIGGFPGWINIWQLLHPEGKKFLHQLQNELEHYNYKAKNKNWFTRIINKF